MQAFGAEAHAAQHLAVAVLGVLQDVSGVGGDLGVLRLPQRVAVLVVDLEAPGDIIHRRMRVARRQAHSGKLHKNQALDQFFIDDTDFPQRKGNVFIHNFIFGSPLFWYVYILLVSFLMVMKRPMLALKGLSGKKKLVIPLLIVGLEVAIAAWFLRWWAIPFGFIGYCVVSLLYKKTITQ